MAPAFCTTISPRNSRVRSVASLTRGLPDEGGLDREPDGHDVGGQRQRAIDGLAEPIVVLAGELDAHEVLDVDLLHRAQVLHPGGDVVHGRLDAVPFERVVGLGEQQGQVVEQQLAEERLPLDGLLLGLDVLVQPAELHVVPGQQRATSRSFASMTVICFETGS